MTVKYGKIYVKDSQGNPIQFIPEGTVHRDTISSVASKIISSGGYITSTDTIANASSLGGVAASSYALDANVVKLSGAQTIGGVKTFTDAPVISKSKPYIDYVNTGQTKGTGTNTDVGLTFKDKNGAIVGMFFLKADTSKNNYFGFRAYDIRTSAATDSMEVRVSYGSDGVKSLYSGNGVTLLGASNARWKEIWCTQNSINSSSDERMKQQVATVPDAVLDAWGDINWVQFKFNDACKEKGAENARLHNGLVAQRVDEAFKAHGLKASAYGLFLHDEWDAQPEEKAQNGTVTQEAIPAGDAYGLRYTEALCMEAAYQRRRADRAEARITALENRLNELEEALSSLISHGE